MAKGTTKSSTDDIFANSLTQARNEIAKLLTPYLKILKLETKGPMTIEALDKVLQQRKRCARGVLDRQVPPWSDPEV